MATRHLATFWPLAPQYGHIPENALGRNPFYGEPTAGAFWPLATTYGCIAANARGSREVYAEATFVNYLPGVEQIWPYFGKHTWP